MSLLLVVFALAAAPVSPRSSPAAPVLAKLAPARGKPLPEPDEAELPGCVHAACAEASDHWRVCVCQTLPDLRDDESPDDREDDIVWLEGNQERGRTKVAEGWWGVGRWFGFDIDLDGDGANELVVFHYSGESNGMGVVSYEVAALSRNPAHRGGPIQVRSGVDYAGTNFVRERDTGRIDLAVTAWPLGKPEPTGAEPTYFAVDLQRFEDGHWVPAPGVPLLLRRYRHSFETERLRSIDNHDRRAPVSWIFSPQTVATPRPATPDGGVPTNERP